MLPLSTETLLVRIVYIVMMLFHKGKKGGGPYNIPLPSDLLQEQ